MMFYFRPSSCIHFLRFSLWKQSWTATRFLRKPRSSDSGDILSDVLNVLSFADDNDDQADTNGEFTSALSEKANMPASFTLCLAFMAEAWTDDYQSVDIPTFQTDDRQDKWGHIILYPAPGYTEYEVSLGPALLLVQVPLQWSRICVALDSDAG